MSFRRSVGFGIRKPGNMSGTMWPGDPPRVGTIDPCVANEHVVVDMRIVEYETERKRSRVGNSSSAGRKTTAGRQEKRRGCPNRRCFRILGKAMASGCGERRLGGPEGQTASSLMGTAHNLLRLMNHIGSVGALRTLINKIPQTT